MVSNIQAPQPVQPRRELWMKPVQQEGNSGSRCSSSQHASVHHVLANNVPLWCPSDCAQIVVREKSEAIETVSKTRD
eukprot:6315216-Prorocentrum_lima.AAC.1